MRPPRKARPDAFYDAGQSSISTYLREIHQIPMLTPEQERELGRRVQAGDQEAREQFITANLRLVVAMAGRHSHDTDEKFRDLIQEGNIGLMKAVEKFDPERGLRFSTHATWWIWQAMQRVLPELTYAYHIPAYVVDLICKVQVTQRTMPDATAEEIAVHLGMTTDKVGELIGLMQHPLSLSTPLQYGDAHELTLADALPDTQQDAQMQDTAERLALRTELFAALTVLTVREQQIIQLLYGLDEEHGTKRTLEQVGAIIGVTRERVRRIAEKALSRLAHNERLQNWHSES